MEGIVASLFAGWTPLHVAAEGGREAVVEVLLRHNADPSLVTDTGLFRHASVSSTYPRQSGIIVVLPRITVVLRP